MSDLTLNKEKNGYGLTVKHFLFATISFLRKFARASRLKNINLSNNFKWKEKIFQIANINTREQIMDIHLMKIRSRE